MNVVYIASDIMLVFKCAGNGRKQGKKGKKNSPDLPMVNHRQTWENWPSAPEVYQWPWPSAKKFVKWFLKNKIKKYRRPWPSENKTICRRPRGVSHRQTHRQPDGGPDDVEGLPMGAAAIGNPFADGFCFCHRQTSVFRWDFCRWEVADGHVTLPSATSFPMAKFFFKPSAKRLDPVVTSKYNENYVCSCLLAWWLISQTNRTGLGLVA